jgi:hypothetical protein
MLSPDDQFIGGNCCLLEPPDEEPGRHQGYHRHRDLADHEPRPRAAAAEARLPPALVEHLHHVDARHAHRRAEAEE